MANLTLTIEDDVLRRARVRAIEQGTSVNALVRHYIQAVAGESPARDAVREALELAEQVSSGSGAGGRAWSRDELYERAR